ncbi:uncharacterized protein LOC129754883 [Uranotaenia lowii]|uniref:uncharacterized protein LOC129754883 n=1 Tax=Uranotaenia lowii TaxID=190385 RepID=UPI00247A8C44|nr:uncharacterized protein LOC129754883 [Uranotaenia lowii]XP_055607113.1 uncharacterized protein LOC129754883 [Uranotaenia lowii]XP_055607114.1 uncharacterized protein LOC129754883 [Uranotaenia lowii]
MELIEFGNLQIPDQIQHPHCIHQSGVNYVVSTKNSIQILQLKYKHINEDGSLNYILSKIDLSKETPTSKLATKEVEIYNSSARDDRATILLDQTIAPQVAQLYINNVAAVASPVGIFSDPNSCLVAHLTNMGQLTLQRYDERQRIWTPYVDISAMWIAHFHDNNPIKKFKHLQPILHDSTITCVCWREQICNNAVHFAFGTKSGKIVICSLLADSVRVESITVSSTKITKLKWVTISEQINIVLACLLDGRIAAYRFQTNMDSTVGDVIELPNLWDDADHLPVGSLNVDLFGEAQQMLIVLTKGTHLIALLCNFYGEVKASASENLNNFMITGLQQIEGNTYLIATLVGAIFMVTINNIKSVQLSIEYRLVLSDMNPSKYSIYGLVATKNRTCCILVGYPAKSFDHLSIRSPTVLLFYQLTMKDPLKILLANPTLRMTDYYDCAEVIRFRGNRNVNTVKSLEDLAATPANVDDSYAYALKLQLIQLGSRLSYFKKRCLPIADVLFNQSQFVTLVIDVLHATKIIYYMLHIKQMQLLNYRQLLTIRCLKNFIFDFTNDHFPGDFEHVHLSLKPIMAQVMANAHQMLSETNVPLPQEECTFCGELILENKLTCSQNHQTFRCSVTRIQIPLEDTFDTETVCETCDRYSLDADELAKIFYADGGQLNIYYNFCCVCDMQFRRRSVT